MPLCPLISQAGKISNCDENKCALWDAESKQCIFKSISANLKTINQSLQEIKQKPM